MAKPRSKKLHTSFRRSYREDYRDKAAVELPGLVEHAVKTFSMLFKNWRLFLPLILLAVVCDILFVGLMSQDTYREFQSAVDTTTSELEHLDLGTFGRAGLLLIATVTTGGLSNGMSDVEQVFTVIIFLILWLVTIYLLRHLLAGHKLKLRDALYNALGPLLSSAAVALVFILELVPIFLVIIVYSAAVSTGFLDTPFYALVFFVFAVLMILFSLYLVSAATVALLAVSAPGLYPGVALREAADLLAGRRLRFAARLVFLVFVVALIYVVVMLPLITLDLGLTAAFSWLENVPFVSFCLTTTTAFVFIYIAAYLYLFYRKLLAGENEKGDREGEENAETA